MHFLALLLIATSALAQRTPTFRTSSPDLSLAVRQANSSAPLQWYHGLTATQVQRDGIEEGLTGIAVPRVINFAKSIHCSSSDVDYAFSTYSKITSKLGNEYEAQAMKNGTWNVRVNGNHYGFEYYVEERIQACAISTTNAVKCVIMVTPDIANYLDIRIAGGKCVKGLGISITKPTEVYNSVRGNLGQVDVKNVPTISASQATLLDAAVAAHNRLDPATGSLRIATEDSATSEAQQHFLRSKDFMSDIDPAWSTADIMKWHQLQNRFMSLWSQKVKASDWFAARQADSDHQLSHICASIKDSRLLVLFSCPAGLGRSGSMDRCPIMTCEKALATL